MIKFLLGFFVLMIILHAPLTMANADADPANRCDNVVGDPSVKFRIKLNNPVSESAKPGDVIGAMYYEGGTFSCGSGSLMGWGLYVDPNMPLSRGANVCGFSDFPTLFFDFVRGGRSVGCNPHLMLGSIAGIGSRHYFFPERLIAYIKVGASGLKPPGESYYLDFSRLIARVEMYPTHYTTAIEGDTTLIFSVPDTPMQVYFSDFPLSMPKVDLNLTYGPGKTQSGIRHLDMCLYDGHNSTSNFVSLTFQDEGTAAAGRVPGMFSIFNQGADKSNQANRLDYVLSVFNPTAGATEAVTEGKQIIWGGMANRSIQRKVALPGIPGLSYCVPAPLTLKTPAFKTNSKNAGHYTGVLRVIYRIPTA